MSQTKKSPYECPKCKKCPCGCPGGGGGGGSDDDETKTLEQNLKNADVVTKPNIISISGSDEKSERLFSVAICAPKPASTKSAESPEKDNAFSFLSLLTCQASFFGGMQNIDKAFESEPDSTPTSQL